MTVQPERQAWPGGADSEQDLETTNTQLKAFHFLFFFLVGAVVGLITQREGTSSSEKELCHLKSYLFQARLSIVSQHLDASREQ